MLIGVLVVDGKLHGDAQRHSARDDGDLVQRIGFRNQSRHQSVTGFVIGGVALFLFADDQRLAFHAHHDLVLGQLEIELRDHFAILAGGHQGCLVHQIGQVGAGESGRAAGDNREIDIIGERRLLGVDPQNHFAALDVGTANHHAAVETARP